MKIFLIICFVAFCSAFVVQTAFQFLGAERSVWGGNPGWQREIAFAILTGFAATLDALYTVAAAMIVAYGLIIFFGFCLRPLGQAKV